MTWSSKKFLTKNIVTIYILKDIHILELYTTKELEFYTNWEEVVELRFFQKLSNGKVYNFKLERDRANLLKSIPIVPSIIILPTTWPKYF